MRREGENMTLLNLIKEAMNNKLATNIVVLDFRDRSPFCDYFIIGTAKNHRMAKSIIDHIEEEVLKHGEKVRSIEGNEDSAWQLIDCYQVVAHVFVGEERDVYQLEKLWSDLPKEDINS